MKTSNSIIGKTYDFDSCETLEYIRVGGVEFFPYKLLEKLNNGNCYLFKRNSIYLLTYTVKKDVYSFKAKKLISGKSFRFTNTGRFFLMDEKYTESFIKGMKDYENFDFEPFRTTSA